MKNLLAIFVMAVAFTFGVANVSAQDMKDDKKMMMKKGDNPMVGGAAMDKKKTIVENASAAPNLTTLVSAVKAADLVGTLSGKGPFTVFAPDNAAFDKIPAEAVANLMKPENKAMLAKVLTYHVVAGKMDSKAIAKAIKKGNGTATLKTVSGGTLKAMMEGNSLVLMDEKGGKSMVSTADVMQSNGVVHVVDTVVMPN